MTDAVVNDLERSLAELSSRLTEPGDRECLRCYLIRMLAQFGCDSTHRWTERWRVLRAPRSTALVQQLARRGACCCDCEVIFNVYPDYPETGGPFPCTGVSRAGSTRPCTLGG